MKKKSEKKPKGKDSPSCRRCGRPLGTPQSIAAGIGPVCLKKERLEAEQGKPPRIKRCKAEKYGPRCRRCGKRLRTLESIAAGIGPTCLKKERLEAGQGKPPRNRKCKAETVIDPRQLLFPFVAVEVQL